jgi:hypothetical protein
VGYAILTEGMSMERRIGVDLMLNTREQETASPVSVVETDDARVARQNREALASWAGAGVPVVIS